MEYYNPEINDLGFGLFVGLFKERNITVDSVNSRSGSIITGQRLGFTPDRDSVYVLQEDRRRRSFSQSMDSYRLDINSVINLNPIYQDALFGVELGGEVVLRNLKLNSTYEVVRSDTVRIVNSRDRIGKFPTSISPSRNISGFDVYLNGGLFYVHRTGNMIVALNGSIAYGWFSLGYRPVKGISYSVSRSITERNTGIKLGFGYRPVGTIDNIMSINLSKTFNISSAGLFKKI